MYVCVSVYINPLINYRRKHDSGLLIGIDREREYTLIFFKSVFRHWITDAVLKEAKSMPSFLFKSVCIMFYIDIIMRKKN